MPSHQLNYIPALPLFIMLVIHLLQKHKMKNKNEKAKGKETFTSGQKHLLLFQRTQVLFPAPTSDSSQPPLTPVPVDLTPSCGLGGQLHAYGTHTRTRYAPRRTSTLNKWIDADYAVQRCPHSMVVNTEGFRDLRGERDAPSQRASQQGGSRGLRPHVL